MADETYDMKPAADGSYELLQLTLQEETYCQLRAEGATKRTAWKTAFGVEDIAAATLDTRVNRLEKRPEILSRITEIRRATMEAEAAKWETRRKEMLELLYNGARRVAHDPEQGGLGSACKAIAQLATMLGWNEPQKLEVTDTTNAIPKSETDSKLERLLQLTGKTPSTVPSAPSRTAEEDTEE